MLHIATQCYIIQRMIGGCNDMDQENNILCLKNHGKTGHDLTYICLHQIGVWDIMEIYFLPRWTGGTA